MLERPPLGKKGPLYRFVVFFGHQPFRTKIMFGVTQWIMHLIFFVIGYVFVVGYSYNSETVYEYKKVTSDNNRHAKAGGYNDMSVNTLTWIPFAYIFLFYLSAVRAAGNISKRWIDKLMKP